MRTSSTFAALATLAASSLATRSNSTGKQCIELDVPISVVATTYDYDMPRIDNNIDAVHWTVNYTTWTTNVTQLRGENMTIEDTFSINAQLCVPPQGAAKADILQIATQGRGFDKRLVT
jgi:hypothetical protein